jgi:transketolase
MTIDTDTVTSTPSTDLDTLAVNTLRFLSAEMVTTANSGHPGLPLGAAPMAWTLFSRHLKHDPADPTWPDRDRFVLSAGHGSALLYALLHTFGYPVTKADLEAFRQLGSRTPGHPEFGHTPGVETTTGPLGQGIANAVGMAIAERMLAADHPDITDHRTYAIVGDGCLMEGLSHEAASLAGRLKLGRLVVLWDDNDITIDGSATASCGDDQVARFESYGWHTLRVENGTDIEAIDAAITAANADDRPSFIAVRTVIGAGARGIEGTPKAHGSPLSWEIIDEMKAAAGWQSELFTVPDDVRTHISAVTADSIAEHAAWEERIAAFTVRDPRGAESWRLAQSHEPAADIDNQLSQVEVGKSLATRQASHAVLKALAPRMPSLVGGSADLAGSTGTDTGQAFFSGDAPEGRRVAFGIREHAMAAVMNGMSVHGGVRPYGSTFLVFSDYLRPALRLSALMRQPVIHILTHDSIGVGEDGPTHQPVEHVESLRIIPGVRVLRPADDLETVEAWRAALMHTEGPTALVLTRQAVDPLASAPGTPVDFLVDDGGRAIGSQSRPAVVDLLATGSEVGVAVAAAEILADQGITARVVSVPWRERFVERRDAVFGRSEFTVSIEAGVTSGWRAIADLAIGIDEFGASGPGDAVFEHFGFTGQQVADRVKELVEGGK